MQQIKSLNLLPIRRDRITTRSRPGRGRETRLATSVRRVPAKAGGAAGPGLPLRLAAARPGRRRLKNHAQKKSPLPKKSLRAAQRCATGVASRQKRR
jgi:hypothetical protein